ncbi:aldo/keto reductase family protein [Legionella maioricensis]|uniref:Aldo/keto reductase n=1 Tax=Legionella maioricensis TaxID=2896528 RepID=A0A9X2ID68_9GAMM|nr:aldo/keto reductase [Legionella maioricensis]MCL9684458.1 aldo/keto reductase [Legionella maioricensis]MCL9688839.1 aldo/keto reductase [Legionella maioricensis]
MALLEQSEKVIHQNLIPPLLYGTAWKEERTQELVVQALNAGFIGIDTANQRKHYYEEGVGLGIRQFLHASSMKREDLFMQTKFTFAPGQDERKPYNDQDSFKNQVAQSFASSLHHLQTEYIDSYVLHGPFYNRGLSSADWEVWAAMEQLIDAGKVKFLGISNVSMSQLAELYKEVSIKPTFVQNRCFASTQWDREIREFCTEHGLIYQGFSLLTANQPYLLQPVIQAIATKYKKTIPQIIFRFAKDMGMLPLTGTTNPQHMNEDLHLDDFQLTSDELRQIELISS